MQRSIIAIVLALMSIVVGAAPVGSAVSNPDLAVAADASVAPAFGALAVSNALAATSSDAYIFSGGGWGHGVGMSQYGAQAQALAGFTSAQILDYYYTDVAQVDRQSLYADTHLLGGDDPVLWIGLLQDQTVFEFSIPAGGGGVNLCQADDGTGPCPKPDASPVAGETWKFGRFTGPAGEQLCRFERVSPAPVGDPAAAGSCKASVTWGSTGLADRVEVDGYEYNHGRIRIRQGAEQLAAWSFHVSLEVELELYLRGLAEVPLSWEPATLQAQVIAGRTYAVATTAARYSSATPAEPITSTWKDICYCHLRRTPADQNYTGWTHESAPLGSKWVAAVDATTGTVLAQNGAPITAWYSSSTGGVTEDSEDVFGSYTGWARSVSDPWSQDPAANNPFAYWSETVPVDDIAAVLGFDSISSITLLNPAPNATMQVSGSKNGSSMVSTVEIPPLYSALGLRSPTVTGLNFAPGAIDVVPAFDDISGSVHLAQINEIAELGITVGCNPPANNLYCPKNNVSRAQMAAFLRRALDLPGTSSDYFTDDSGTVFQDDINRLAAASAPSDIGCGGTLYCPWDAITRSEMALFIVSSLNLQSLGQSDFTDIASDPNAAEIRTLADYQITVGCNPPSFDQFCPNETVTRAQMASFIVRALGVQAGQ